MENTTFEECRICTCAPFVQTSNKEALEVFSKPHPKPGSILLDLGCGTGRLLRVVCNTFKLQGIGVELNEELFWQVKKYTEGFPIVIYHKSITDSAPEIGKADYIWCFLFQDVNNDVIEPLLKKYAKPNAIIISKSFTFNYTKPLLTVDDIRIYPAPTKDTSKS